MAENPSSDYGDFDDAAAVAAADRASSSLATASRPTTAAAIAADDEFGDGIPDEELLAAGLAADSAHSANPPLFRDDSTDYGDDFEVDERDVPLDRPVSDDRHAAATSLASSLLAPPASEGEERVKGNPHDETVTASEVETHPKSKAMKSWLALKKSLTVKRHVDPTFVSLVPKRASQFLRAEPRDDRSYTVEEVSLLAPKEYQKFLDTTEVGNPVDSCWVIKLTDGNQTREPVVRSSLDLDRYAFVSETAISALTVSDEDATDQDKAQAVGQTLCNFVNRAPVAKVVLRPSDWTGSMLTAAAVQSVDVAEREFTDYLLDETIQRSDNFGFDVKWVANERKYECRIWVWNLKFQRWTGQSRFYVRPREMSLDEVVDDLPQHIQSILDRHQPARNLPTKYDDDEEKRRHEMAIKVARQSQYKVYGACANERKDLTGLAQLMTNRYKRSKSLNPATKSIADVYDKARLLCFTTWFDSIGVGLGAKPMKDILERGMETQGNNRKFQVLVKGNDKARASYVANVMLQTWLDGGNSAIDVLDVGMHVGDQVNRTKGDANFCIKKADNRHPLTCCQLCLQVGETCDMVISTVYDTQVHQSCQDLTNEAIEEAIKKLGLSIHSSKLGMRLRRIISRALYMEDRAMPQEFQRSKKDRAAAVHDFVKSRINKQGDWEDDLLDVQARQDNMITINDARINALQPSFDAAIPFCLNPGDKDVVVSYHDTQYCVVTGTWSNLATNTWLKPTLAIAADACKLKAAKYSDPKLKEVNHRFDHAMAVRGQYPHQQKTRKLIRMDMDREWPAAVAEMKEAVLRNDEEVIPAYIPKKKTTTRWLTGQRRREIWDLLKSKLHAERQRRQQNKSAAQKARDALDPAIEDAIQLPANSVSANEVPDMAPFFGNPSHWPGVNADGFWGWDDLEDYLNWHYDLLWFWCDRHFDVEEDLESLLFELIWQWFERGGRGQLFYVPWTLLANHPAGLAFAHEEHGRAMRTRVVPLEAGDAARVKLSDLKLDKKRLNMSMESRIENYAKSDFPSTEYPAIVNELLQVKRDCEWIKPPSKTIKPIKFSFAVDGHGDWVKRTKKWCQSISEEEFAEYEDDSEFGGDDLPVEYETLDGFSKRDVDVDWLDTLS